jgi:hypothetical protein
MFKRTTLLFISVIAFSQISAAQTDDASAKLQLAKSLVQDTAFHVGNNTNIQNENLNEFERSSDIRNCFNSKNISACKTVVVTLIEITSQPMVYHDEELQEVLNSNLSPEQKIEANRLVSAYLLLAGEKYLGEYSKSEEGTSGQCTSEEKAVDDALKKMSSADNAKSEKAYINSMVNLLMCAKYKSVSFTLKVAAKELQEAKKSTAELVAIVDKFNHDFSDIINDDSSK